MRSKRWSIAVLLCVALGMVLQASRDSHEAVAAQDAKKSEVAKKTEDGTKDAGPFQISAFVTHHTEFLANGTTRVDEVNSCLMVDMKTGVLYSLVGDAGHRRWLRIAAAPPK